MRFLLICIVLGLCSPSIWSQSNAPDFDPTVYTKENGILGIKKGRKLRFENREKALELVAQVKKILTEIGEDSLYVRSVFLEGEILGLMGNNEDAFKAFDAGWAYAQEKELPYFETSYVYHKGRFLNYDNQRDSALHYFFKYRKLKDFKSTTAALNIGAIYSNLGDRNNAEIYLEEALKLNREKKSPMDYLYTLSSIMEHYQKWNDYEKVAELKNEYLEYKVKREGNTQPVFAVKSHLGANLPFTDFKEQEQEILRLLPYFKENNNVYSIAQSSYALAKLYHERGMFDQSYPLIQNAIEATEEYGITSISFNLQQIAYEAAMGLSNEAKAIEHLNNAFALKDSIRKEEMLANAQELAEKYEAEKKENDIQLLKTKDELKTVKLNQANNRFMLVSGASVILLFTLTGLLYFYFQDRKKQKQLEEKNTIIAKALKEKDILLREIHHRVKNNLQVISSLLSLQSNYIKDESALQAIKEGKNRVSSMALIHQNLYQKENLTAIHTQSYFESLIESIFDSYQVNEDQVSLTMDIQNIHLDVDTMIPLGLIVNELVCNALKHAFTNQEEGKIDIKLTEQNGLLSLFVADNGKGVSESDFLNSKSFGNKIIKVFKEKLDAKLSIDSSSGTAIQFDISNYNLVA